MAPDPWLVVQPLRERLTAHPPAGTQLVEAELRGQPGPRLALVDRAGVKRVALVGDNAAPVSTSASYRKAYTAANAGITSAAFGRLVETPGIGPVLGLDPSLITFGGGVPIKLGDRVVGGIGVAGAPSAEADEACALAGLAQLTRQPK